MESNMQPILQSLLGGEHLEQPHCRSCLSELYAFIDAELDAEDAARRFSLVQKHLRTCSVCQEEYGELKALLAAVRRNELVEPPVQPTFDFSYLEDQPIQHRLRQLHHTTVRPIKRFVTQIRGHIDHLLTSFLHTPEQPSSVRVPASAIRSHSTHGVQRLCLPIQKNELQIGLVVGPPAQHNTTVGVQVNWAETGKPASRIRVTVRDRGERMLASELTSARGCVSFPQIAAGDYLLEVRHRDAILHVPLAFRLGAETS